MNMRPKAASHPPDTCALRDPLKPDKARVPRRFILVAKQVPVGTPSVWRPTWRTKRTKTTGYPTHARAWSP
jgi:hypothetical protein